MDSSEQLQGKQFITTSQGTISLTTWHLNYSYLLFVLNNSSVNLKYDNEEEKYVNNQHKTHYLGKTIESKSSCSYFSGSSP